MLYTGVCKKAKKYGRVNKKGGVGPPDGVVGGGYGGPSGFEVVGGGCYSAGQATPTDNGRGIGRGHGARPDLPRPPCGLATVGHWLRDSPQLVSVLTETAYKIGGRGCL